MSAEKNKAIYRRFINEVLNGHKLNLVPDYVTEDFVDHRYPGHDGPAGTQRLLGGIFEVFPDAHFTLEHIIAEGEMVVVNFTARATHKGEFLGHKATGKKVTWSIINIARFADGKVAELWGTADLLGLSQQLTGK